MTPEELAALDTWGRLDLVDEVVRLRVERDALRAALVRVYGVAETLAGAASHGRGCDGSGECVCGLEDRREELVSPELLAVMEVSK